MKPRAAKPVKNVHGRTLDLLGEAIVAGRYAVGTTIPPEPQLGAELGVSRTGVREAVKALAAKGLLVTGPKVGSRVQPQDSWNWFDADVITWKSRAGVTHEFLRDLQDLRRVVEPAAVRLAAQRADADDIAEIEAAFAGMTSAVEHGGDYVTHDLRFHRGLLLAAGNRMLTQMSKPLDALLRTTFQISTSVDGGAARSLPLHRAVLDAVAAHRPAAAQRAVMRLIDEARVDTEAVLAARQRPPRLPPNPPRLPRPARAMRGATIDDNVALPGARKVQRRRTT